MRRKLLSTVLLVIVLVFVASALIRNWSAVREDLRLLGWQDLIGSGVFAAAAMLVTGFSWRLVLTGLGAAIPVRVGLRVFSAGQLGKYVPGSVWAVAIQAEMGRQRNIPRSTMALSYFVSILISIATGGLIGLLTLASADSGSNGLLAPSLAILGLVLVLAVVRPRMINAAITWLGRRVGRALPPLDIPGQVLAIVLLLNSTVWVLFGIHAWLLARPLGAGPDLIASTIGGFALAYVAGLILIPLPAGAGVREGVLAALLAGAIGPSAALTVTLVSRLILVIVDVVLAGAFSLGSRSSPGPAPA